MSPLQKNISPMAFLTRAREYADAANELFGVADTRPKIQGHYLQLSSPLYFLYSHAAELGPQGFLAGQECVNLGTQVV